MVCYEDVVKNVVDIELLLRNNFIFSCDCFQYDILLFCEALQIEQTKNNVAKLL